MKCRMIRSSLVSTHTLLNMAPRFDPTTEKWYPTKPEEEETAGYGSLGTSLLTYPTMNLNKQVN